MLNRVCVLSLLFIFSVAGLANDPFKLAEEGKWDEVFKMVENGSADLKARNAEDLVLYEIAMRQGLMDIAAELITIEFRGVDLDSIELESAEKVEASPDWPLELETPAGGHPRARRALDFSLEEIPVAHFDCSFGASPVAPK